LIHTDAGSWADVYPQMPGPTGAGVVFVPAAPAPLAAPAWLAAGVLAEQPAARMASGSATVATARLRAEHVINFPVPHDKSLSGHYGRYIRHPKMLAHHRGVLGVISPETASAIRPVRGADRRRGRAASNTVRCDEDHDAKAASALRRSYGVPACPMIASGPIAAPSGAYEETGEDQDLQTGLVEC
jgi:hypothetical protein